MDSVEMSKRAHFWLRLAALVVIAGLASIPRGVTSANGTSMQAADASVVHTAVAGR
jgi:hypothetical protein